MNATLDPTAQRKLTKRYRASQNLRDFLKGIGWILGIEDSLDLLIRQTQAAEVE